MPRIISSSSQMSRWLLLLLVIWEFVIENRNETDGEFHKEDCPPGYYCDIGTSNYTKYPCPKGYICPKNSIRPMKCPFGSFIDESKIADMVTIDDVCKFCGPGSYASDAGCAPCPAGYICLGKTFTKYPVNPETDNGYECPPGHFCLEGALKETPCPIGTYRNIKKGKNATTDCFPCPSNTFNDKIGQPACKKCGPSAISSIGSTTCNCTGKYREFFKSDSSCRCISGFYQVKYGIKSTQDDSSLDCEPHVYSTCSSNQIYNYKGECVDKNDCKTQCNGNSGKYSEKYGVCICDYLPAVEKICNETCRNNSLKTEITPTEIKVTNPTNPEESYTIPLHNASSIYSEGLDISTLGNSKIKSINNMGGSFRGHYGPIPAFAKTAPALRRLLQESNPSITSPAMCVTPNETVAFGVSREHYPVYLKDSLVNTVKNFDYGPFITLADKLTKSTINTDVFLYRFVTIGTYLFGDSAQPESQMMIKVAEDCSEEFVMPMTEDNLALLGVSLRDDIVTKSPLWIYLLIVGVLFGALAGALIYAKVVAEWMISWTYGKDMVTVMDKKKADEPDEEDEDEMARLVKKGEEDVDGLFFVYLKQKLNEMDEKMRELLAKANISSLKKLKKLADKINHLKEIFNEHVGSLIMPNGMTIDEYLKANVDQLDHDSSYYSSVIDESEGRSDPGTPREKPKPEPSNASPQVVPEEEKKEFEIAVNESGYKVEQEIEKDIKREAEKAKEDEEQAKGTVQGELKKRKDEYINMVLKHGATGNVNEIQEFIKGETEHLAELQGRLSEELEGQNAGLQDKLMKRQEKKLAALAEIERLRKEQEETDAAKMKELEKIAEEQKAEIELVDKETTEERERGKQIIDKTLNEQLAEHHARFIQQFAESPEKEKLLARHEGETLRLKEYLESEKRRQERELDIKLEQRSMGKKKEIMVVYDKRKEAINQKYQKINDENEARRAIIEGQTPALEDRLIPYAEQLEAERKKVSKQQQKDAQSEDIVLEAKKRAEMDAIEKEYQLEERKIYLDNRQEVDEILRKEMDQEKSLKDKFTKEIKTAPTSKEKNELLAQYEKSKKDLKTSLENERKKMDEKMEERLAERRRQREKKKIQLDAKLEQDKQESDKKAQEKLYLDIEKRSDEAIEQLIGQAIGQNQHSIMDVPVIFEYLIRAKLNQNMANLKKAQFTELSQQLGSVHTQLMKEKFIEIAAVKETTEKKVKDLEKKSLAPEVYQRKLEQIQKNEVMKIEAINANYENKTIGHESRVRTALANQHCNELLKLIDTEEANRSRVLDRVLRRFNGNGDIPKNVIEELNAKKAEEFNEMREEVKLEKDKKLMEAQKILGEMDQEDLKEMEKKYAQEIEAESRQLDKKLRDEKKKAIEERRKQYEDRLAKIPEISIEQRKQLMEEHKKELDRLEQAMGAAREDQLRKLKEKLINKKIQQERLRSRAEQKAIQRIKGAPADQVVIVEGIREQAASPQTRQKVIETKISSYAYKPLLKQWAQKLEEKKAEESKMSIDKSLLGQSEKVTIEENKESMQVDEAEGAYVNMKELFETVLNCYDLANNVQEFEFPEIAKGIEKLTYLMEAILKGGKRLGEAGIGRLGVKSLEPQPSLTLTITNYHQYDAQNWYNIIINKMQLRKKLSRNNAHQMLYNTYYNVNIIQKS
eukprot:TRINITY_DN199_c0_g2_i2.p1 TRINITY_DN199_c0_g2~~TRINITY_DN199_c0_g2_i2.p1  ORF type:complete len:1661 (-),score=347.92 TRINITY_DN199_c0_g2_i2:11367-16349(-)